MSTRKYLYGKWNQTNADFELGKTNESSTKEAIKDAIDNNINVLFVGGCKDCSQCEKVFTLISNLNNTINKDFLFNLKIYLMTYHRGTNGSTKDTMKSYINDAATAKGISFSFKQYTDSSTANGYSCHAVINMTEKKVYWVQAITSVSKSTITKILGDNPIPTQYKVIFKDSDGTILKSELYVDSGADAICPSDPSKSGYTFVGWEPSYKNITSDRTCIAQYKKNKNTYKVTFKDEDGTVLKGPIDVDEGATAPAPTPPTKTGKTFNKWNPSNVNIQADTTCIACYTSSSGLYSNTITKRMFYGNRSLASIDLPAGIEHIDESAFENCEKLTIDIPSKCKTIGARAFYYCKDMNYIKIPITITSIGSEALASSTDHSTIDMTNFNSSSSIPSIQTNSFIGYGKIKFADVNTSKHFYGNSTWKTYYPIFDPKITYTIRYNSNGGSGNIDSQDAIIGEKWTCKANAFSRDKYDFINFNSKADGSGTTYNPGSSYDCPSSDITLYAIWKEQKKVLAILETALQSSGGSLTSGCKYNVKNIYDMVKSVYGNSSDIEYHILCDNTSLTIQGLTYESPTKTNILDLLKKGVSGDYSLVIMYLMDHGSGSSIGAIGGSIKGTDIANVVKEGVDSVRVMFICDCCHAAGMAPFKLDSMLLSSNSQYDDAEMVGISADLGIHEYKGNNIFDEIFNEFDSAKASNGMPIANSNPNPKFLGWYTCEANRYGWMGSSGAMFLLRIKLQTKLDLSYLTNWSYITVSPYYYYYKDSKNYSYYGYTKKSGSYIYEANHTKYNYNNNFDESKRIFT